MEIPTKSIAAKRIPVSFLRAAVRRALKLGADDFLAFAAIARVAPQFAPGLLKASSVTVLRVPDDWSSSFVRAINETFSIDDRRFSPYALAVHPIKQVKGEEFDHESALKKLHLFVLAQPSTRLVPEIEIAKTADITVSVCSDRDIKAYARLRHTGLISTEHSIFIRQQAASTLHALFRPGRSTKTAVDRLRELNSAAKLAEREILSLETLPGLGDIGQWGRDLAVDIEAWRKGILGWSAIDRGLLLYGPPGTGKTLFARALANTCKMEFVSASLAKWQANGHLGDTLKAMRKSFAAAMREAPSILFLDEIDAIGDREKFAGDHVQYHIEVVNALLELIDGSDGRDGVIVIGACNAPERLDKALIRSGRLEKHVFFDFPDEAARLEILRYYLPEIADQPAMTALAKRLTGWSQADLNKHARQVRKNARRDKRERVTVDDLLLDLPENQEITAGLLRRFALHEAGHALVALALGRDVDHVNINLQFDDANKSGHLGITMLLGTEPTFKLHSDITRRIAIYLAGLAAEEIFLDQRSTSGGGGDDGDLFQATELAHMLVARFGLGRRLASITKGDVNVSVRATDFPPSAFRGKFTHR